MVPRGRCAAAAAATVVAAAVAAVAGAQTVVKLNAGGGAVGAFAADAPALVTGASRANVLPAAVVTGTAGLPRALYTSRRYAGEGGTFAYAIPVERGTYYAVRLHFAEIWERVDAPGARLFSVALEGATVLCNYDVFADVGTNVATVKTFTTVVTDGVLDVEFTSVVGTAMVMAIEVEPSRVVFNTPQQVGTGGGITYAATAAGVVRVEAVGLAAFTFRVATSSYFGCYFERLSTSLTAPRAARAGARGLLGTP
eukprot:contig_29660_g7282